MNYVSPGVRLLSLLYPKLRTVSDQILQLYFNSGNFDLIGNHDIFPASAHVCDMICLFLGIFTDESDFWGTYDEREKMNCFVNNFKKLLDVVLVTTFKN